MTEQTRKRHKGESSWSNWSERSRPSSPRGLQDVEKTGGKQNNVTNWRLMDDLQDDRKAKCQRRSHGTGPNNNDNNDNKDKREFQFGIDVFFFVPLSQPWTGLFWPRVGKEENRVLGSLPDTNESQPCPIRIREAWAERGSQWGGERQLNGEDDMDQRSRKQRKG